MNFSLIIPLYNEEDNVKKLIETVEASLGKNKYIDKYEILCINDGSSDKTLELLKKHKTPNTTIFTYDKNSGQSAAIKVGIKNAKYEMLGTIDGDLQNNPDELEKLFEKQLEEDFDCVTGARVKRNDPFKKRMSTYIARKVRNWVMHDNYFDITSPMKIFKKKAIEDITFFNTFHRFIPFIIKMQGFTAVEVPVNHYPRNAGKSKYGIGNRLSKGIKSMRAIMWMKDNYVNPKEREV